ncbi:hypothetical protein [Arthrobacter sp. H35-D1]|uniref:hypothetical protein n=1 Tax=Arthrobacter sp. H35-D1 TaxID=3046202 RepID=UPI0024BB043F|nr:hypothetical protein [Arthrobacter sp. H35-D1]MDJ0312699.1 hypothetical protein [Arthrobacter sp. H35-D1]
MAEKSTDLAIIISQNQSLHSGASYQKCLKIKRLGYCPSGRDRSPDALTKYIAHRFRLHKQNVQIKMGDPMGKNKIIQSDPLEGRCEIGFRINE